MECAYTYTYVYACDVYSSAVFLELSFLLIFGNCLAGLFILFWEVVTTALFYVSKNPKMMNGFAGNFVDAIPPAPDG